MNYKNMYFTILILLRDKQIYFAKSELDLLNLA